MSKKHLLLMLLLCFAPFMHGKMTVNMGMAVQTGSYYTFPDATVTPGADPAERAYTIRVMFTRATADGDRISYPSTPSGWTPANDNSPHIVTYNVAGGATAAQVQAALRTVQFSHATTKKGQAVVVMLFHEDQAGRTLFYSTDKGKWYEFIKKTGSITWKDAYNEAHDLKLMGMTGNLATITDQLEQDFIKALANGNIGWVAGTRFDIRTVMDPVTGKLTGVPTTRLNYWYWADGKEWTGDPEKSRFYSLATFTAGGTSTGMPYPYNAWSTGEPNDSSGEECAHLLEIGLWNDFKYDNASVNTYLVEYENLEPGESGGTTESTGEGEFGFVSKLEASVGGSLNNGTAESPVQLLIGDEVTYTITAANSEEVASTLTVTDALPAGLEYIDGSADNGGIHNAGTITWSLNLAAETSGEITFKAKKAAGAKGDMVNTAVITNVGRVRQTNSTFHRGMMAAVTFTAGTGGTLTGGTPQDIDYGMMPAAGVVQETLPGYEFDGWSYPAYISLKGEQQPAANEIEDYTTVTVLGDIAFTAMYTAIPYIVTVGDTPLGDEYTVGDDVPITAPEPPDGQLFYEWTSDPEVEFADPNNPSTTFEMPAEAVTITPVYRPAHTVTIDGGTPDKPQAAEGQTVTLTPNSPPEGQVFYRWESDDVEIRNPRDEVGANFVMPAGAVNITAVYRNAPVTLDDLVTSGDATTDGQGNYTLTEDYTIPEDGGLEIAPGQTLVVPDEATLTNEGVLENEGTINNEGALENEGSIYNDGTMAGNKPNTETGTGTVEHSGTVSLDELVASGDATTDGEGNYTLTGDYDVIPGSELVVADGETLIIPDGETLNVPEDATLTIPETATLTNDGKLTNNGTLANEGTIDNKGGIENNGTYEGTGTMDNTGEITLDELVMSGDAVKSGDSYILEDDYTVPAGSEVVIGTDETLVVPEDATLTIPEDAKLTNNSTLTNNGSIDNSGTLVFVDDATLDGDGERTGNDIVYTATRFTVEAAASAGGTITPAGAKVVVAGGNAEFIFTPDEGYEVSEVLIDGESTPAAVRAGKYTFENVMVNHTISVTFAAFRTVFTIYAEAGIGGTINPGTVSVNRGSAKRFHFIPDEGYIVDKVLVDGREVPEEDITNNSYLFKGISADHSIGVTFCTDPTSGNAETEEAAFRVWAADGQLYISGLTPGEAWSVYSTIGVEVRQGTASGSEVSVALPAHGIYIVKAGRNTVKIIIND